MKDSRANKREKSANKQGLWANTRDWLENRDSLGCMTDLLVSRPG